MAVNASKHHLLLENEFAFVFILFMFLKNWSELKKWMQKSDHIFIGLNKSTF